MATMEYKNFSLDTDAHVDSLKILINQCWKTLPIYEGKDRNNKIVYSREKSHENYLKHLNCLVTKLSGASKLWQNNQYYVELVYILSGMTDYNSEEHSRVKNMVHHCTNLINKMIKMVSDES